MASKSLEAVMEVERCAFLGVMYEFRCIPAE